MRNRLRATLIVLASAPIAFAVTVHAAAATSQDTPTREASVRALLHAAESSAAPTPSASPSASPSGVPPASVAATASANTPASPNVAPALPHTNLTAVVDPIAVQVSDGYQVRVGVRNSGPQSITAPPGESAASLRLQIAWTGPSRSLSGCEYSPETPPIGGPPSMAFYVCRSGQTLPVAETHWESFIFPTTAFLTNLWISVSGYADDPNPDDNTRKVEVRVGDPLPVTGAQLIYLVGGGVALIMAGAVTLWYTRRRRPNRPAISEPARATRE